MEDESGPLRAVHLSRHKWTTLKQLWGTGAEVAPRYHQPPEGGRIAFIRTTSRRIQASANTIKDLKKTIRSRSALKATQGQTDGFLSQLPYKFHVEEVTSMGY
jgi:hypothetical protein